MNAAENHLQKCCSKLLRECMEIVSQFQACSRIRFLQDSACIRIHLERICIIKSHKPFLVHIVFKVFFLFQDPRCKALVFKIQKHSAYMKFFSSEDTHWCQTNAIIVCSIGKLQIDGSKDGCILLLSSIYMDIAPSLRKRERSTGKSEIIAHVWPKDTPNFKKEFALGLCPPWAVYLPFRHVTKPISHN